MILTVTLNPSVDMAYHLEQLRLDDVNRVAKVEKTAGGKGLNVTRVLHQLGNQVTATGLIGGAFGQFITRQLTAEKIAFDFTEIAGETRCSLAILADEQQTEVLETGPVIDSSELEAFLEKYAMLLPTVDLVTISGSLPPGVPVDIYQTLVEKARIAQVPVLVDTSEEALRQTLAGKSLPTLIKPNSSELSELLGLPFSEKNQVDLLQGLNHPMLSRIEWVVVSLGSEGALVKHQNRRYRVKIPKIAVTSPVGSGDATLAGLAAGIQQGKSVDEILKIGMTAGMLNAQEARTGWINPENFAALFQQIEVSEV